jgi:hypothetical protein
VKLIPLRAVLPTPSKGSQRRSEVSRPPLQDEVFEQPPDRVVDQCRHDRGALPEAAPNSAGDVVLAAAFPCPEASGGVYPQVSRIEPKHHLAERDDVVAALGRGLDRQVASHARLPDECAMPKRS